MGWTDLEPTELPKTIVDLLYTPDEVANFLADEGLADWVSVDLADWDKD